MSAGVRVGTEGGERPSSRGLCQMHVCCVSVLLDGKEPLPTPASKPKLDSALYKVRTWVLGPRRPSQGSFPFSGGPAMQWDGPHGLAWGLRTGSSSALSQAFSWGGWPGFWPWAPQMSDEDGAHGSLWVSVSGHPALKDNEWGDVGPGLALCCGS